MVKAQSNDIQQIIDILYILTEFGAGNVKVCDITFLSKEIEGLKINKENVREYLKERCINRKLQFKIDGKQYKSTVQQA